MPRSRAKPPRRKPKQARAHETVGVVLDAAARVVREHGYAAATTNRIAAEAGVSVGSVYEYFANKEAVCEALIRREIDGLVAAFTRQPLAPDLPLEEAFRRLIEAGIGAMGQGPELFRALEAVPGASFRRELATARRTVIALVRQLLEVHRDVVRVADLDLAAFVVVSAVEGVGANATERELDTRLVDELTTLVSSYLTAPGS